MTNTIIIFLLLCLLFGTGNVFAFVGWAIVAIVAIVLLDIAADHIFKIT